MFDKLKLSLHVNAAGAMIDGLRAASIVRFQTYIKTLLKNILLFVYKLSFKIYYFIFIIYYKNILIISLLNYINTLLTIIKYNITNIIYN